MGHLDWSQQTPIYQIFWSMGQQLRLLLFYFCKAFKSLQYLSFAVKDNLEYISIYLTGDLK